MKKNESYTFKYMLLQPDNDDMSSKEVRTEVPIDGQKVSKYSFVSRTVDSAAARNSLFYHYNN